jgi:hypothetical protein
MTYRVYITQNPLHRRNGYQKRMERINGHAPGKSGTATPPAVAPSEPPPAPPPAGRPDRLIDETEALRRVRALRVNHRSLWNCAEASGAVARAGRLHMYSAAFVDDLAGNYFTREEALDLLGMPVSSFWEWVKVAGIRFVQVGSVSLFPKDAIMAKRRAR